MKSKVFFISLDNSEQLDSALKKLDTLIKLSDAVSFIKEKESVAVKLHFGEEGNTGYVKPQFLRLICEAVKEKSARPFLSDTNTLYRGRRLESESHKELAYEHGFTLKETGAEVIIPDDKKGQNVADVSVDKKYVKNAKVAKIFLDCDDILGVAHFKGHIMTGFGGALKNIGMGCAARTGKLFQHSVPSPFVLKGKCIGCKLCLQVCPVNAITMKANKAVIDSSACIGCASCIAACKSNAIELDWELGGMLIQEKMVEYSYAVLSKKKDKAGFFNFALKITKECDCLAKDDPRIVDDIGIFFSRDPVSIDKACYDMVLKTAGKDVFKEAHPKRDGLRQLRHAEDLGLGSLDYELVSVG